MPIAINTKQKSKKGNDKWTSPYVVDLKAVAKNKEAEEIQKQYKSNRSKFSDVVEHWEEKAEFKKQNKDLELFDELEKPRVNSNQLQLPVNTKKVGIIGKSKANAKYLYRIAKIRMNLNIPEQWGASSPKYHPEVGRKIFVHVLVLFIVLFVPIIGMKYLSELRDTKGEVINASTKAVAILQNAKNSASSFDFHTALNEVMAAQQQLEIAQQGIHSINPIIKTAVKWTPVYGKQFRSGEALLEIGTDLTEAATYIGQAMELITSESDMSLTERLSQSRVLFEKANNIIANTKILIKKVNISSLPDSYQAQSHTVISLVPVIENGLSTYLDSLDVLLAILGHDQFQRYLLVFENNNELRPTGGFMGSFAILDVDRGEIKNIEIPSGGTYDIKGGLFERISSPEPLRLVNPLWQFQDSNWFYDFSESADKMMWFLEKSGGPSVDGVIVITSKVMEDILSITGPIEMSDYGKIITSSNFENLIQFNVEYGYDEELNNPKQIVSDMTPVIIDRIINAEPSELLQLGTVLVKNLEEKHILINFVENEPQEKVRALGWSGEISDLSANDYLAVVHTNIAGGKTDGVIKNSITHTINISDNGEIQDTVNLTRKHEGNKWDPFEGIKNNDYVRFYVPKNSELVSTQGFTQPASVLFLPYDENSKIDSDWNRIEGDFFIDEESDTQITNHPLKTIFANWIITAPSEQTNVSLIYNVPNTIKFLKDENGNEFAKFVVIAQKQAGTIADDYVIQIKKPDSWDIVYKSDNNWIDLKDNVITLKDTLDTDKVYALIFSR